MDYSCDSNRMIGQDSYMCPSICQQLAAVETGSRESRVGLNAVVLDSLHYSMKWNQGGRCIHHKLDSCATNRRRTL
jgi:hypothetical protein